MSRYRLVKFENGEAGGKYKGMWALVEQPPEVTIAYSYIEEDMKNLLMRLSRLEK